MNKVQLLGRIGTDPKMHGTERTMVSFPLATHYYFKVSNEDGSSKFNVHTTALLECFLYNRT